jgi:hypothetical protein
VIHLKEKKDRNHPGQSPAAGITLLQSLDDMGHPTKLLDSRTNSTRGRTPRMYPPGRPSRHDSNIPRWYCQSEEWMRVGFESAEEAISTWVADQSAQCSSPQGFPLLDPRADYRITLEFHHILRVATRGYPIEPLQQDQKTYKTRSARRLVMPTHNGPPTTISQPVVYGSILFQRSLKRIRAAHPGVVHHPAPCFDRPT